MKARGGDRAAGAVALVAFGLYVATSCRTVYFGDSGELIAAAHSLGIAHPPGYPLYTLIGHVALQIPIGEAALRVNLLSGLLAALTCALVSRAVGLLGGSTIAAVSAGLALAVSRDFWGISTVAEVYALHLLLLAALVVGGLRLHAARSAAGWVRTLFLCAVLFGLGLAHRPTILLAVPAVCLLARGGAYAPRGRRAIGLLVAACLVALVVPLLFYGYLMLRSGTGPVANWGRPDDLGALLDHIGTRAYGAYLLGPPGWLRGEAWWSLLERLWRGFGYIGLPLALLGLLDSFRRSAGGTGGRVGLALLVFGSSVTLFGLSYGTEDVHVLFLPLSLILALALGLGLTALERVAAGRRVVVGGLALIVVAAPAILHARQADLSDVTAARDYGLDMLDSVPPAGLLFVEGDDAFVLAYLHQVRGLRPDVTIHDRNGQLFEELPEPLRPLADRSRIGREVALLLAEAERARPRSISFMSWPGYELPPGFRFEPVGLFYRARADGPASDPDALWTGYHEVEIIRQALRLDDPFARTVAATYPLMRGERALFEGRRDLAREQFERAGEIAPDSESLHNYLGTIYGRLGDYPRAVREFEKALVAKPVSVRAWNNLARARGLAADTAGRIEALRRSLALDPDQADVRAEIERAN